MLDAVIIGGGHNGLVAAFYLARAGLGVRVVERRPFVGGAAITQEFAPGFRNSVASYTVSLLRPQIVADMRLAEHGYRVVSRELANFLPLERGYLKVGNGLAATQAEIAKFSAADAAALPAYYAALETVADVLRDLALRTPPNAGGGWRALLAAAVQGRGLARLDLEAQRNVLALFTKSAREILDAWFESDAIKAAFGFDAVVGNFASPDTPGSAYVLLHHVFGEVNGVRGAWGHAIGGMGAITQAMAAACLKVGVAISVAAPVAQVLVNAENRTNGIRLASGEVIAAKTVVANVTPRVLFETLCDPADLPAAFRKRMAATRYGSGSFRMNVALSELPDFAVLPGIGAHHGAGIIIAPTLDYMDRAFTDARQHGWSRQPIVEMTIPSIVDLGLAPPGQHVASLFAQHFAYDLGTERKWDTERAAAAACIVETVTKHAPNFADAIIAQTALSPLDLERDFGLTRGDIFHGSMGLDQIWASRPLLGNANYRAPIRGLYLCGAGSHPGGGVTGAPGHNAAREILRDRRWWKR